MPKQKNRSIYTLLYSVISDRSWKRDGDRERKTALSWLHYYATPRRAVSFYLRLASNLTQT